MLHITSCEAGGGGGGAEDARKYLISAGDGGVASQTLQAKLTWPSTKKTFHY